MVAGPRRPLFAGVSFGRRVSLAVLAVAAVASLGAWMAGEALMGRLNHPAAAQMQMAAGIMQAASQAVRAEKRERGLLQSAEVDPNQTGLIGPEFSEITTSLGILAAKRTATNPDLAAALTRRIADLELRDDAVVVALFSGSMVGANVATLAALQALGLETIVISSVGASMFGATDSDFTWVDMEGLLFERGVTTNRSSLALIGGNRGTGHDLPEEGIAAMRASIARAQLPLIEADTLPALLGELEAQINALAGDRLALFINAGGSVAGFGSCQYADRLPVGVSHQVLPCGEGEPGLLFTMSARGLPVIHLLNMRGLAAEWGLPYDPIPFELVGNNRFVYGSVHQNNQ